MYLCALCINLEISDLFTWTHNYIVSLSYVDTKNIRIAAKATVECSVFYSAILTI